VFLNLQHLGTKSDYFFDSDLSFLPPFEVVPIKCFTSSPPPRSLMWKRPPARPHGKCFLNPIVPLVTLGYCHPFLFPLLFVTCNDPPGMDGCASDPAFFTGSKAGYSSFSFPDRVFQGSLPGRASEFGSFFSGLSKILLFFSTLFFLNSSPSKVRPFCSRQALNSPLTFGSSPLHRPSFREAPFP